MLPEKTGAEFRSVAQCAKEVCMEKLSKRLRQELEQ